MRILYGCNSQGQGHLSKAAVLVPLLEARGHVVQVVSSGPTPPPYYRFRRHRHFCGLSYSIVQGQTRFAHTLLSWLRDSPRIAAALRQLRLLVREFLPDLILSDFEPLTASPLLNIPCETISICRQAALLDPDVPLPQGYTFERNIGRTMIRLFTLGVDRRYGIHYAPDSCRCVPPIIRPELLRLGPSEGDHLLVYNFHHTSLAEAGRLIAWANKRRQPVRVYGFEREIPRGRQGTVEFRRADREMLLADLATCAAVISTAGFTTPLEAFLTGKPVSVVPLGAQWEQATNALHQSRAGIAQQLSDWDYDAAFDFPAPAITHPLRDWLQTPPDRILDFLLGEEDAPAVMSRPVAA